MGLAELQLNFFMYQLHYFSQRNVSGNLGYTDNLWNSLSTLVTKDSCPIRIEREKNILFSK